MLEPIFQIVADLQACSFIKKETPTQVFSCSEIFKNTYFEEHMRTAASELTLRSDCLELCFWTVAVKTILTL